MEKFQTFYWLPTQALSSRSDVERTYWIAPPL